MAKKTKKDKDAKKARSEAKSKKNLLKAASKDQKRVKKFGLDSDDEEDLDIDTILQNFKLEQEQFEKVVVELVPHPTPRNNACLVTNASKPELLLFGGERTNNETNMTKFYNDLHVYNPQNNQWKKFTSQNSPMPRSSAAMCSHQSGVTILFGGEFSSPKQNTFYHYNDTWLLDNTTREWSKLDFKNGPSARSGHRITTWKNYFILFGGFKDLNQGTSYFNDVWLFNVVDFKWTKWETTNKNQPDPRSGHSWIGSNEGPIVYGGYCKVKAKNNKSLHKGKTLTDCWILKMSQNVNEIKWERRAKKGQQPSPRVGCSMALHRNNRGILFGGVYDLEETEEDLSSIYYNDLYSYNIESNRWYPLKLRKVTQNSNANRNKSSNNTVSKEQEKELQDLLNKILEQNDLKDEETNSYSGSNTPHEETTTDREQDDNEEEEKMRTNLPKLNQLPHERFNACTTVLNDTFYIYGGMWEFKDNDYTIDSFYSIDLNKLDGITQYYENLQEIEEVKRLGDVQSEDDFEYEDDDDEDDGEAEPTNERLEAEDDDEEENEEDEGIDEMEIPDPRPWLPHPKAFESLREFYIREGPKFLEWAISNNKHAKGKHLKQKSFELCQDRWWERRDQIQIEEDKLQELGVGGDIIERDAQSPPTARRR
ncbi:Kel3p KNAG_0E02780 [Huiozyma naganishii CBS 8797]|uniref:DUF4110 domain-containing protein n=1 Tax=Huiozyma naganishii (strain ATCC MYA-139 / BCRC 22969 / CBS 8797 / KCTC 17520 / NBRC 10181 / NCYC 3082 / Yp74L-3) TaxID=1071383 RepID=J7RZB4_HUIN7|nr:hypothetical protein KNAG_0E02780 [Kazachstania naganishii CBS 8797]CCK70537.1 hypothetical protein KNAG_0E02780 [Kazachstania naganishii CBS 8797]